MLPIIVPGGEYWDEKKEEMLYFKDVPLKLEHSLISISKWESIWHVPFIGTEKTEEQTISYLQCMSLNSEVSQDVFIRLIHHPVVFKKVLDYISNPMTASTISSIVDSKKPSRQVITSELIYYWMSSFGISYEAEKWHINRLIMLIRIASEENKPKKKQSRSDVLARYNRINEMNRAKFKSKG